MNNTFNINRFGLLLKRQWLDFGKIYLISLVVLAGVLIAAYALNTNVPKRIHYTDAQNYFMMTFRIPVFVIVGMLFISIVASTYFAYLGQKPKAILDLMIPASIFEKFLAGIFYSAIVGLFSYLLIFYLTDVSYTAYINSQIDALKASSSTVLEVKGARTFLAEVAPSQKVFNYFIAMPFLLTGVFLLGSIYFDRFHYIKTAVSVMVFAGIATYIVAKVADILTKNMVMMNHTYYKDKSDELTIFLIITILLTFVIWAIAYIRLKEKEV
ncbi:hypothetical protein [Pedobacter aquatilis]|uniref:hypothetical protein n=1 Tax=Pedobacter aquatilis TaxID=351343 RepID=UPI002930BB99|nr:hypothetical protein [Pedobacter aquatilis]